MRGQECRVEGAGVEPKDRDGTVAGTAVLWHYRKQEYCPAQLSSELSPQTHVPAPLLQLQT